MFGRKKERERDQRGRPLGTERILKTKEKLFNFDNNIIIQIGQTNTKIDTMEYMCKVQNNY